MTIGMPVVALATTELPSVIDSGVHGYISCEPDELITRMRDLLGDPELARRLGANARELAHTRFGMPRFIHDWNAAFAQITTHARGWPSLTDGR
jgi:glycosyltransferase involved in cell wall biosynthesis